MKKINECENMAPEVKKEVEKKKKIFLGGESLSKINLTEYEYEKRHQVRKGDKFNLLQKLDEKTPQEIQRDINMRNQKLAQDAFFKQQKLKKDADIKMQQQIQKMMGSAGEIKAKFAEAKNANDYNRVLGGMTPAERQVATQLYQGAGYVMAPNPQTKALGFAPDANGNIWVDDKLTPGPVYAPPATGAQTASTPKPPTVAVNNSFDEYLHMIKVSPTKALEHITQQKNLNEFVEYLETLTQKDIDEKVENRGNYYTFKFNLANHLNVYGKLKDKESFWNKVYFK